MILIFLIGLQLGVLSERLPPYPLPPSRPLS